MGEAHNLCAGIAESTIDAVAIGAIGPGDGNLAVPDGDDVGAGIIGDGEFLIHPQVDGTDDLTVGGDFGHGRRGGGDQKIKAQTHAPKHQTKKQDGPIL